jgi:NAD-dependent dihydropyrimidine dehydrogenase PreA subunit
MLPHLEPFFEQFGVWPVARAYARQMFADDEIGLVVALGGRALTASQMAAELGLDVAAAQALAQRCYHRLILNKEGPAPDPLYRAADFYAFLDYFIKYGDWDQLPLPARQALDGQYREGFVARVKEGVALKMAGQDVPDALPNDAVLLLPEVEAMIDAATDIVVELCDCRRASQLCDRPVETCLRLDESARAARDRGHGRALTKDEARQLLRLADKKGLMHSADAEWQRRGLHSICNCCACDCYPFRAAEVLGSKGVWPKSRYVAEFDSALCTLCGLCVRRCHFGAFYHDGSPVTVKGKNRKAVAFDPEKCWGCGLCANACPADAIAMKPLPGIH